MARSGFSLCGCVCGDVILGNAGSTFPQMFASLSAVTVPAAEPAAPLETRVRIPTLSSPPLSLPKKRSRDLAGREAQMFSVKRIFFKIILGTEVFCVVPFKRTRPIIFDFILRQRKKTFLAI